MKSKSRCSIKEEPRFYSKFLENGQYIIYATMPEYWELTGSEEHLALFGKFLKYFVQEMVVDSENKEMFLAEIEDGKRRYLFDREGKFINHSRL